jgi:hypothetical protein
MQRRLPETIGCMNDDRALGEQCAQEARVLHSRVQQWVASTNDSKINILMSHSLLEQSVTSVAREVEKCYISVGRY